MDLLSNLAAAAHGLIGELIDSDVVDFTEAKPGQAAYAYVDPAKLSDFHCVFQLDYFDDRSGPVHLRRQKWVLVEDEPFDLPDPLETDDDE